MSWYDSAFAFKKSIVIPHGNVRGGSDLLDFPVLIEITDFALAAMLNGGQVYSLLGYDLLFTDGTETRELPYELERYDNSAGTIVAWVRVPVLSASEDTVLYLYFGNSAVTGFQASAAKVWDTHYKAVWHLNSSSADSTSNAKNGTDTAISYAAQYIGGGASTTSNPSGISIPTSTWSGSGDFTLSFWMNPNAPAAGNTPQLFGLFDNTASHFYGPTIFFDPLNVNGMGNGIIFRLDLGFQQIVTSPSASSLEGSWTKIDWIRSSGTNTVYYNGLSKLTWNDNTSTTPANGYLFSRSSLGSQGFSSGAHADEYRFSDIVRTPNWMATEYTNQNNPSSFIIIGQTIPLVGNVDVSALAASGVTTSQAGVDQINTRGRGGNFTVNVSLCGASETLTLHVQGKDGATGQYYTLASFPNIGLGTTVCTVYPGLNDSSTVASAILPRTWRVTVIPSTADTAAYQVGASLIS